jgi:hypothetical protein
VREVFVRLQPGQVCSVFGDDLFEDITLMPIYRSLLGLPDPDVSDGVSAIKPLECVGTVEEARQSLLLAAERHRADIPDSDTGQRCIQCRSSVVATRTDTERKRLPRNLQVMLDELGALGVGSTPRSLEHVREAHINDFNAEHNIPSWLLQVGS